MKVMISLMCLAFFGVCGGTELSQNVLDFTFYFNGDLDSKIQYEAKTGHLLIHARMVPLEIPIFHPYPAIFIEESINGEVQMLQIGVVRDGQHGTVEMQIYDFTTYSNLKPFEYDYTSLTDVKWEDLKTDDDCVAVMTVLPNFMTGTFPDCRYTTNGKHPRIIATYTCNSATAVFPAGGPDEAPLEPYQFRSLGPKYPQVLVPDGYVNPCEGQ